MSQIAAMRLRYILHRAFCAPSGRLLRLRAVSPTSYFLERFFAGIRYLFPVQYFAGPSSLNQVPLKRTAIRVLSKRWRRVEVYLAIWLGFEVAVLMPSPQLLVPYRGLVMFAVLYRIADIAQTAVNVTIFDRLRAPSRARLSSFTRLALLSLWNYIELAICFAALYLYAPLQPAGDHGALDALFLSMNAQLTVAVKEEWLPAGWRWVPPLQVFTGFLLALIALSRFISLLPSLEALDRDL